MIAPVAGGNSRLNVLMDVVARPSANRVLIDGERDHLLSDRRLRLAKSDAFLAYNQSTSFLNPVLYRLEQ